MSSATRDSRAPYSLISSSSKPDAVDEFTGIPLGDVWRYFRYTWTIPATNIPGRQLWYVVRDAAHSHHAVMGIAALSNAPLQLKERDAALSWTFEAFREEAEHALTSESAAAALDALLSQLETNLARRSPPSTRRISRAWSSSKTRRPS